MSWETRERGGPYYTRTRRVNGHQIREYVGGGILGQEAAEIDAEERERREAELQQWNQTKRAVAQMEDTLKGFSAVCTLAIEHELKAAGYFNHRGEWRKRRE